MEREEMGSLGAGTPSGERHTVQGCALGAGQAKLCFLKTWGYSGNESFTCSSLNHQITPL